MTQILIQGLLLSGLYALIAVGFTLIFSVGRVLNLAYGAYLMLGGYAHFTVAQTLGAPKLVGVIVAGAVGVAVWMLWDFRHQVRGWTHRDRPDSIRMECPVDTDRWR